MEWLAHWDMDEYLQFVPQIGLPRYPYRIPNESDWRFPLYDILEDPEVSASLGMVVNRLDFPNIGWKKLANTELITQAHVWRRSRSGDYTKSFVHNANQAHLALTAAGAHDIRILNYSHTPVPTSSQLHYSNPAGEQFEPDDEFGGYHGQRPLVARRLILNHYMQRDLQDCIYKANRRQKARPVGWRAKLGPEACTLGDLFVPRTGKDNSRIRSQLVFDDNLQRSYASLGTRAILRRWLFKGRPSGKTLTATAIETISTPIQYYP